MDEFSKVLKSLLPKGAFWQGKNFLKLIEGMSLVFERIAKEVKKILIETFPENTSENIESWENFLSIENKHNTIEKRRLEVISRLITTGGNTYDYFLSLAKSFDKEAIILKKSDYVFRAGKSRVGDSLRKIENEDFVTVILFSNSEQKDLIIETFNKSKPAHVFFVYKFRS